jgi:hypothetical protein
MSKCLVLLFHHDTRGKLQIIPKRRETFLRECIHVIFSFNLAKYYEQIIPTFHLKQYFLLLLKLRETIFSLSLSLSNIKTNT